MTTLPGGVEPMRNVTVKIDDSLRTWLLAEAARHQCSLATALRRQLYLAWKYREAIADAERAPARFTRSR